MQRGVVTAEKKAFPMRRRSRSLFGKALVPLERGSPAARLEQNQGSKRRRYCNLSIWLIKLIRRIGENLVTRFGGRNRSKENLHGYVAGDEAGDET